LSELVLKCDSESDIKNSYLYWLNVTVLLQCIVEVSLLLSRYRRVPKID